MELTVDARQAPALGEGEWWAHELEGCAVVDGERLLGTVSRLIELPSCEALEVAPEQRRGAAAGADGQRRDPPRRPRSGGSRSTWTSWLDGSHAHSAPAVGRAGDGR